MTSQKLLWFAAVAVLVLLLMQPVAAVSLRDVFGAFVNLGNSNQAALDAYDVWPEPAGDGVVNFGDVIYLLQQVFGIGRGGIACSSDADCGGSMQGDPFCDGDNLMYTVIENVCLNPGTRQSNCDSSSTTLLQEVCTYGCSEGSCFNQAPIADAGTDQAVSEGEEVTLDGSASSDPDGTIDAYEWKEGETVLSNEVSFAKSDFSVGGHTITLTVTDDGGATGTDTVDINVSPPELFIVKKIWEDSLSRAHSCAVLNDGSVKCWGYNYAYQLGDGTYTDRPTPVYVVLNMVKESIWVDGKITYIWVKLSNATFVSLGMYHACAILSDNSLKCWGWNAYGMLGDGTATTRQRAVSISGISNVTAISLGRYHSCAILSDNSVKCWGGNKYGQLGDGTISDYDASQNDVSGIRSVVGISNATAIALGGLHTCAILSDNSIKCWGNNSVVGYSTGYGMLGDGSTTNSSTPVSVVGISNATAIALGEWHSCAVLNDGSVKCWGYNAYGQLGDGTTEDRLTPVSVVGISNATAISLGKHHSCALLNDNSVKCWGENTYGSLGDGTTEDRLTPVSVVGISNAKAVTVSWLHACAQLNDNTVKCWGYGLLADGTSSNRTTPVYVVS